MSFNLVLVHPQIPNNTGAIGRLCVNAGATLHLIKPIGFDIDEKAVRRAGLDYWDRLDLKVWESIEIFLNIMTLHVMHTLLQQKQTDPILMQILKRVIIFSLEVKQKVFPKIF